MGCRRAAFSTCMSRHTIPSMNCLRVKVHACSRCKQAHHTSHRCGSAISFVRTIMPGCQSNNCAYQQQTDAGAVSGMPAGESVLICHHAASPFMHAATCMPHTRAHLVPPGGCSVHPEVSTQALPRQSCLQQARHACQHQPAPCRSLHDQEVQLVSIVHNACI